MSRDPDRPDGAESTQIPHDTRAAARPAGAETTVRRGAGAGAEGTSSDDLLADCLERLAPHAPLDDPRQLLELLPAVVTSQQPSILIELIKLDMSAAFEAGRSPRIEHYLAALSEHLKVADVPLDLVWEEHQLRRGAGEKTQPSEYARRFPHCAGLLDHIAGAKVAGATQSAARVRRSGPPEPLAIGSRLDDFLIVRSLGQGAFAQVYLARQLSMQRLVALKVSRGGGGESQTLAQLDHPNIVRVFDQRPLPELDLHLLYMQYLPGGTLTDLIQAARVVTADEQTGRLLLQTVDANLLAATQQVPERSSVRDWLASASWPMLVAWLGVQLARALDEAHYRHVLHRDVKPANVLLSAEGIPKLVDFNVSFAAELQTEIVAPSVGGSVAYMAPEHLQAIQPGTAVKADAVREPADLYSLAVLLWELWQGHRPFDTKRRPGGLWSDLVQDQLDARHRSLSVTARQGGGSERVLEQTLRNTLVVEPDDRPQSGAELAARLRLALYPETAGLFDPPSRSLPERLLNVSPWLVVAAVILLPNIVAGVFNFFYNQEQIITKWSLAGHPEIEDGFERLATTVNMIVYPLGAALVIWFTRPTVVAIRAARDDRPLDPAQLNSTLQLGRRAAWIGGALWGLASLVYPLALSSMYPWFPASDAAHFFVSLIICGGVAAVYPYFGMAVLTTLVYYPRLLSGSMQDPNFDDRAAAMQRHGARYLLAASGIPLLALALLLSVDQLARGVMAVAVAASALGLLAAFYCYQCVQENWSLMANVLSSKRSPVVPGANQS